MPKRSKFKHPFFLSHSPLFFVARSSEEKTGLQWHCLPCRQTWSCPLSPMVLPYWSLLPVLLLLHHGVGHPRLGLQHGAAEQRPRYLQTLPRVQAMTTRNSNVVRRKLKEVFAYIAEATIPILSKAFFKREKKSFCQKIKYKCIGIKD